MTALAAPAERWMPRWHQLVRAIARVHSERGEQQLLEWLAQPQEPVMVAFVDAHAMNSVAESDAFFQALMSADVVLRDGIGMALLMAILNQRPGLNLNGANLIPKILEQHAGSTIALFGTQEPWLSQARETVSRKLAPGSACVVTHGFHETAMYVRLAALHRPSVIVLGMGMPRQEEVGVVLRAALGFPCLILCGGDVIDLMGGRTPLAPAWMRRFGLEWLYRMRCESKRLSQRYVVGNPVFITRILQLAARGLQQEPRRRSAA